MLKSKKAQAFLIALITITLVHLLNVDEDTATKIAEQVMMLTMGYMGAQGIADHGKEKAKIETKS